MPKQKERFIKFKDIRLNDSVYQPKEPTIPSPLTTFIYVGTDDDYHTFGKTYKVIGTSFSYDKKEGFGVWVTDNDSHTFVTGIKPEADQCHYKDEAVFIPLSDFWRNFWKN